MSVISRNADDINIESLTRLFDSTTNSYKLVFFLALLNILERQENNHAHGIFSLREIAIEMIAIAWVPHKYFRLFFGEQDKIASTLEKLVFNVEEQAISNLITKLNIRESIEQQYENIDLNNILRYVPYRLLSPFFVFELQGTPDHKKNALIRKLAEKSFIDNKPVLYRFVGDSDASIEIAPAWINYLRTSLCIVKEWAYYHWIVFLQARNPNTPAIPNKILLPISRAALSSQAEYWKTIMDVQPVRCIYSGEILSVNNFSLDHFIPWSYVCHDQLWNIIPVLPKANSSKGNRLPADRYIHDFIDL